MFMGVTGMCGLPYLSRKMRRSLTNGYGNEKNYLNKTFMILKTKHFGC